jgi:multiple sugar transport system ATP-binding protein
MVFQNIALYSHMTAADNILYPLKVRGVEEDARQGRLETAAEMLQIAEYIDKRPPELSGGQQQRVALARCLVQQPRAFLFDEPTSNLDAKLKVEIRKEIQKVAQETEETMIYVTHDQEEAMTMSDKIIVMDDGEIMQVGTPDGVYDRPRNTFVGSFIGTPTMNLLSGAKQGETFAVDEFGSIDIPSEIDLPDGEYIIGFRPENANLSNGSGTSDISVTVELTESIGNGSIIYTRSPQGEIRLLTDRSRRTIPEGDSVDVDVNSQALVWFDPESREILHKGH